MTSYKKARRPSRGSKASKGMTDVGILAILTNSDMSGNRTSWDPQICSVCSRLFKNRWLVT